MFLRSLNEIRLCTDSHHLATGPSASRNDLSLEINFTPTVADMSWRIVLSSSTHCCRITSSVLGEYCSPTHCCHTPLSQLLLVAGSRNVRSLCQC